MSSCPSASLRSDIANRLRAAGCVFAEDEAALLLEATSTAAELGAAVEERVAGLPLEHILGWVDFSGLRVAVTRGVFVPRRRTEFLVAQAIAITPPSACVVDLCCGTGAVGAAIASATDPAALYAVDIDPLAVACALDNLAPFGGQVLVGDLYAPLPSRLRGTVDVIVANAPYVPTDAIGLLPAEAREHEPREALDGGGDGLSVQRRVAARAPTWLAPGGHLLIETSQHQASMTAEVVSRSGLAVRVVRSDELDATVVVGTRPSHRGA